MKLKLLVYRQTFERIILSFYLTLKLLYVSITRERYVLVRQTTSGTVSESKA